MSFIAFAFLCNVLTEKIQHNKPWFEDGNILLVTKESPTGFRVHQGVLVRYLPITLNCNTSESQVGIDEAFRNIQRYA